MCLRVLPREEVILVFAINFLISLVASVIANYISDKFKTGKK